MSFNIFSIARNANPILLECSISIPPENTFMGAKNRIIDVKLVKFPEISYIIINID